jgi:hypothetical protein
MRGVTVEVEAIGLFGAGGLGRRRVGMRKNVQFNC